MQLFFRKIGKNKPALIILHGLYGASDNWMSVAKYWSIEYEVYLVDLRNHGQSPHSKEHTYAAMREDLLELMDENKIQKGIIVGHSMGGKLAMRLAMDNPERLNMLVVIDIAPKNYTFQDNDNISHHKVILNSMLGLDLKQFQKREEINKALLEILPEERTRQLIMKNIKRNKDHSFSWKLNLSVINSEILNIMQGFSDNEIREGIIGFPVLFVQGEKSEYIQKTDKKRINKIFPFAEIKTISNVGHWIHSEKPQQLSNIVLQFLEK